MFRFASPLFANPLLRLVGISLLPAVFMIGTFGALSHAAAVAGWAYQLAFGAAGVVGMIGLLFFFIGAKRTATVVSDGISVDWLWQRTFLPFADIERVEHRTDPLGVAISLTDGREVRLRGMPKAGPRFDWEVDADARAMEIIALHMQECLERARQGHASREQSLMRRGRDLSEWLRSLQAMGSGADADHRTAPARAEELWSVLESPAASPEARAGAAVALGAPKIDRDRQRLRIVADGTGSEPLRQAVEAAAREDQAELEAALAEVSSDGSSADR